MPHSAQAWCATGFKWCKAQSVDRLKQANKEGMPHLFSTDIYQ
jgi:hypothetical protein